MNVFLIADTHFGHAKMNTFVRDDGTPLRPFQDVEEMNEVNDQILEGIREEEREVRQNLDMAESRIREVKFKT